MPGRRVSAALHGAPWPAKLAGKLVLSRLPLRYAFWRRTSFFKHGAMAEPGYAYDVFRTHFEPSGISKPFVALEVGPGDSALSGLVAYAFGATRIVLVDIGDFATHDLEPYRETAAFLIGNGLPAPSLDDADSFDDVLARCSTEYMTNGIESLRGLASRSVDFSWSHAVLEHVRRDEMLPLLQELRRVMRTGGVSSHEIDLRDHLSEGLNNLRFSSRVWESKVFARSGFYTNRLRRSQFIDLFRTAGFDVETVHESRWPAPPTPRRRLAREFRALPEDELSVMTMRVVLRPA